MLKRPRGSQGGSLPAAKRPRGSQGGSLPAAKPLCHPQPSSGPSQGSASGSVRYAVPTLPPGGFATALAKVQNLSSQTVRSLAPQHLNLPALTRASAIVAPSPSAQGGVPPTLPRLPTNIGVSATPLSAVSQTNNQVAPHAPPPLCAGSATAAPPPVTNGTALHVLSVATVPDEPWYPSAEHRQLALRHEASVPRRLRDDRILGGFGLPEYIGDGLYNLYTWDAIQYAMPHATPYDRSWVYRAITCNDGLSMVSGAHGLMQAMTVLPGQELLRVDRKEMGNLAEALAGAIWMGGENKAKTERRLFRYWAAWVEGYLTGVCAQYGFDTPRSLFTFPSLGDNDDKTFEGTHGLYRSLQRYATRTDQSIGVEFEYDTNPAGPKQSRCRLYLGDVLIASHPTFVPSSFWALNNVSWQALRSWPAGAPRVERIDFDGVFEVGKHKY